MSIFGFGFCWSPQWLPAVLYQKCFHQAQCVTSKNMDNFIGYHSCKVCFSSFNSCQYKTATRALDTNQSGIFFSIFSPACVRWSLLPVHNMTMVWYAGGINFCCCTYSVVKHLRICQCVVTCWLAAANCHCCWCFLFISVMLAEQRQFYSLLCAPITWLVIWENYLFWMNPAFWDSYLSRSLNITPSKRHPFKLFCKHLSHQQ